MNSFTVYIFDEIYSGCRAFSESCSKAQEPEDVTVGLIVGESKKLAMHSPAGFT